MKIETNGLGVLIMAVIFSAGFACGMIFTQQGQEKIIIPVSERITECENKGGEYHLYKGWEGDYTDYCESEKNIELGK